MYLTDAVDVIREKLVQHRLTGRKTLWVARCVEAAKTAYTSRSVTG
jgi:hypothetical protein